MVAIRGGAGTVTLLLGLALVLAGQTVMAEGSRDPDLSDPVHDLFEDRVEARGVPTIEQEERPADPFAQWILASQEPRESVLAGPEGIEPSVETSVDDAGFEVSAVVEGVPDRVGVAVERTKDRLGHEQGHEDPEGNPHDDGSSSGQGDGGSGSGNGGDHGDGPSLKGEVCGFMIAVCQTPSPSELTPDLPAGPTLPGLPEPSGPGVVDDTVADDDDGPPWRPQEVAVAETEEDGALGVALAAAAATALVAAVAATTATGSTGSIAAWVLRVFAGVKGFFLSLYARLKRDKVLDHGTRKELFLFIQANPGSCITQIQRVLGTSLSTTRHHLDTLRSHGLVVDVKSGRKRCFFTREDGLSPKARTATAALTSKAARRVYRQIERKPGIGQQELAKSLGVSRTSVIFHVRRLQDAGVVRQGQEGRQVVYHPVDDGSPSAGPPAVPATTSA